VLFLLHFSLPVVLLLTLAKIKKREE